MKKIKSFIVMLLVCVMTAGMFAGTGSVKAQAAAKPATPKIKLTAGSSGTSVKVKIYATSGAEGYRIYMKSESDAKYRRVKTLKKDGSAARTYTVKNLDAGTYSFRVRAYLKDDGVTRTGSYCKAKSITVTGAKDTGTASGTGDGTADRYSEQAVYAAMIALKAEYPDGKPWTNANEYFWGEEIVYPGLGYGGLTGCGCVAFAMIVSDAAFGNLPVYEYTDKSQVRVGDILRTDYDSHSVIVLEINGSTLTVAEGNINSSILWGRKIDINDCGFVYGYTRYPRE